MAYFEYRGKSVYYGEYGQGTPLIFLHGNTASSKMFELLMPLYSEKFRCILIDFLGNGKSADHCTCGTFAFARRQSGRNQRRGVGSHECGVRASGFI